MLKLTSQQTCLLLLLILLSIDIKGSEKAEISIQSRILNVEQSNFVPLVFSCTGGAESSAQKVMQRLAEKKSAKSAMSHTLTL